MRSLLGIVLSAFIVNFAWTTSQQSNRLVEQAVASVVKDGSEIRENFQNLLKSIAKNEAKESGRYRHILKQEIERGREAFDILEEELMVARSPSANRKKDFSKNVNALENVTVRKREADDADEDTEATVVKRRYPVTPSIWDGIFKNNRTITYEGIISLFRARAGYVIDVRRKEEIEQTGSIPSSLNIPLNELSHALNMSYKDYMNQYNRDKPGFHATVIFTCRSGRRSGEAVRVALAMGYTNPFNYVGGWLDWEKHVKAEEEAHIVWPWWD